MSDEELEALLDGIEPEDIRAAIAILEKRHDSWQDWLSMPSA